MSILGVRGLVESDATKEVSGIPCLLPQVRDKESDDRHVLIPGKIGTRFKRVWGSLKEQVYPLGDGTSPLAIMSWQPIVIGATSKEELVSQWRL